MVLGLCRLLLRDHHEAEDAAQQTFVSAHRSLLRGTEPREPGPWLAAIARNECRARLRKRMRQPIPLEAALESELSDSADLADVADQRAEFSLLTTEIAKLPSRQREAIALRDFLGLSYEEVASTLKVSVPVVESLLFRARRRLRDTVRTVPRYAAGLVIVPLALRSALARDIPDFDGTTVGLGIAGAAATAAGVVAKFVSMPAAAKVAATVAVVATGTVVGPKLVPQPSSEAGSAPSTLVAAAPTPGQGSPQTATTPQSTGARAESSNPPQSEPSPAAAPSASAEVEVAAEPPVVDELDPAPTAEAEPEPDRTSANTTVDPAPAPAPAADSCPTATAGVGFNPWAQDEAPAGAECTEAAESSAEPAVPYPFFDQAQPADAG
jgi:RNA polymerase sigma-70 factor (ECF subfamily)